MQKVMCYDLYVLDGERSSEYYSSDPDTIEFVFFGVSNDCG